MIPVDIEFTDLTVSKALSEHIEDRVEKLEHHFGQIQACRVVVSAPHRHHQNKYFHVQIKLNVPRKVLIVSHEPEKNERHQDPYQSVNDAFAAMTKKLETYATKLRDKKKKNRESLKN